MADYAARAAQRLDAPLEFLHNNYPHPEQGSGDDRSGAIGINAQEQLLLKLTGNDEARIQQSREQGRIFLNRLRERAIAAGAAAVDVRQRYGQLEETVMVNFFRTPHKVFFTDQPFQNLSVRDSPA